MQICQINTKDLETRANLEVMILRELNSKYIVKYISDFMLKDTEIKTRVVVTELMIDGNLNAYLNRVFSDGKVKPAVVVAFTKQIILGLSHMHDRPKPIVHRDIKCDNLFISSSDRSLKIGDMGLATPEDHARKKSGTLQFMAPEMLEEHTTYDRRVDIYALGMVVYEMFARHVPYHGLTHAKVMEMVLDHKRPEDWEAVLPEGPIRSFVELCTHFDQNERCAPFFFLID